MVTPILWNDRMKGAIWELGTGRAKRAGHFPGQPAVLLDLQWHEPREKNLGPVGGWQSPKYPIWSLRFFPGKLPVIGFGKTFAVQKTLENAY